MILWTIQTKQAWKVAQQRGYLVGDVAYVWEDFLSPYLWMMDQMKKRINFYTGEYPVWLWVKRPDLRCSGHLERGTQGILLEVELNPEKILLSDFDAWHIVLHDAFLALDEEEDRLYEQSLVSMTKEQSWERIFDYQSLKQHEYWNTREPHLQAVTGKIELAQIKSSKEFLAR